MPLYYLNLNGINFFFEETKNTKKKKQTRFKNLNQTHIQKPKSNPNFRKPKSDMELVTRFIKNIKKSSVWWVLLLKNIKKRIWLRVQIHRHLLPEIFNRPDSSFRNLLDSSSFEFFVQIHDHLSSSFRSISGILRHRHLHLRRCW